MSHAMRLSVSDFALRQAVHHAGCAVQGRCDQLVCTWAVNVMKHNVELALALPNLR